MKPYIVKIPKTVWAVDKLAAMDIAEKEFGARPAKAKPHPMVNVPRGLFDIAEATGWPIGQFKSEPVYSDSADGQSRWIGDGSCFVRLAVNDPRQVGITGTVVPSDTFAKAIDASEHKAASVKPRRGYSLVGEAIVAAKYTKVIAHFFQGDVEWRAKGPQEVLFVYHAGELVAAVMPMREAPDDPKLNAIRKQLAEVEKREEDITEAVKKADTIRAAADSLGALRAKEVAARTEADRAANLASQAYLLLNADTELPSLRARINELRATLEEEAT